MMRKACIVVFVALATAACGKSVQLGPVPPGPQPGSTPTSTPTSPIGTPAGTPSGTPTVTPTGIPTGTPTGKVNCPVGKGDITRCPKGQELRTWCFVQADPVECKGAQDPSSSQQQQQQQPPNGCPSGLQTAFILDNDQGIQPDSIVVLVDGMTVPATFFSLTQDGVAIPPQDAGMGGSSIVVEACVAPTPSSGKKL